MSRAKSRICSARSRRVDLWPQAARKASDDEAGSARVGKLRKFGNVARSIGLGVPEVTP